MDEKGNDDHVEVWSDWGDEPHEIVDESTDRQHQAIQKLVSSPTGGEETK